MTAGPTLSPEERIALDEFKRRVQRRYGPRFVELRLSGVGHPGNTALKATPMWL